MALHGAKNWELPPAPRPKGMGRGEILGRVRKAHEEIQVAWEGDLKTAAFSLQQAERFLREIIEAEDAV